MYGDVEENFGLLNRTLEIFDRAINKLPKDQIFEVLRVCLAKTTKLFGVTKTRKVYEVYLYLFIYIYIYIESVGNTSSRTTTTRDGTEIQQNGEKTGGDRQSSGDLYAFVPIFQSRD